MSVVAAAPAAKTASARVTVLHVLEAVGGGTVRHLIDLVSHTAGVRHVVAMPTRRAGHLVDTEAAERLTRAGADVRLVEMRRNPLHWRNARSLHELSRLAREIQPDVIHGHSSIGGALARAMASPAPRVYTAHGVYPHRLAHAVERALAPRTARFVAVSESEGALALDLGLVTAQTLRVIPNGVDMEAPAPVDLHAMLGLAPGTPLVGTIARLLPQKAPRLHVEAFERIARQRPDVHFLMVGCGPDSDVVEEATRRGPLAGRLHHFSELPCAEALLPSLDVFVLLSAFEGGPYSPLQAARAMVPLVLTDVVGNRDVVEPGTSGELVPFGDADAAAKAVVRLLDDPRRAEMLAAGMLLRLVEQFSVAAMGAAHQRLYLELAPHQMPRWLTAPLTAAVVSQEGKPGSTAKTGAGA